MFEVKEGTYLWKFIKQVFRHRNDYSCCCLLLANIRQGNR